MPIVNNFDNINAQITSMIIDNDYYQNDNDDDDNDKYIGYDVNYDNDNSNSDGLTTSMIC